ncbi:unnamed protein product [Caenorhabditis sp. 36 PRJEB53466]|nr:unnamed protein product [Caenorhabditis sp. 36 PRJEB53466]
MFHDWRVGKLFVNSKKELFERQTQLEINLGFSQNDVVPRVFKYAVIYFAQFIADPINLTFVIFGIFSRTVLNFFTLRIWVSFQGIWWDYDIDESYFVPVNPKSGSEHLV